MSAERILSGRELNRALLARQGLLERSGLTIPSALRRIGGLQAQYAPSMYVGLWSRMDGLAREDLTRALQRRSVVQATLMRVTIHLVARGDFWPFALATREYRRTLWLRAMRGAVAEAQMAEAAALVAQRLAGAHSITRKELDELVGRPRSAGVGLWIDLVRAPPSGTWERRRADIFALAEDWIGAPELTPQEAVDELVRRYLAGFGPASRADIASFTGIAKGELAPVLERLALRRFRGEGGEELLDVAAHWVVRRGQRSLGGKRSSTHAGPSTSRR